MHPVSRSAEPPRQGLRGLCLSGRGLRASFPQRTCIAADVARMRPLTRLSVTTVAALTLVVSGSGSESGAAPKVPRQPLPDGPVYAGIPGALPHGFTYRYNRLSPGWPVRPRSVQHPIRGAFIDPRGPDDNGLSGYHFGIDVSVDDHHPDRGAPPGLSHRVYALDSGVAREPSNVRLRRCGNRRVEVGHFSYWHVSPIVPAGRHVAAGQQIGWTCTGEWHVHVSEWQRYRGRRIWVNPLHPRGAFRPYTDTAPPVVSQIVFTTPPRQPWEPTVSLRQPDSSLQLSRTRLHGLVDIRVRAADPQSYLGFLARNPAWPTQWTPYELETEIRSMRSGRLVLRRTAFRADQLPQTPYLVHYAPGTVENDPMSECVGPPALARCDGVTWLRALSRFRLEYWNTTHVPNGVYRVTVDAVDIAGNVGSLSVTVLVDNRP